ncbi:MAG: NAD-dependent epimerase/dehydratase family protein [Elusimicrobiota bacterium]
MKVLVTGGGGFLGKALARRLLERGESVRSFSRGEYPELSALGVEVHRGDLADPAAVAAACEGMDAVFHVGAKAGIWGAEKEYRLANVEGTRNVLEACRKAGVEKLVFTSSPSVVFGGADLEGVDESIPYPKRYEAAYPRTKAEAERRVLSANGPELLTTALRPHLIWGPGDNHLVPRLLARSRAGALRRILGPPCRVDSTYIDNAVDAHLLALDRLSSPQSPPAGKAYFIAQDEPMPLWELIDRILEAAGEPPVRRSVSPKAAYAAGWLLETVHRALGLSGEPRMTRFLARELSTAHWFDLSAARRDLGYCPRVSTAEGLSRLKESFKGY